MHNPRGHKDLLLQAVKFIDKRFISVEGAEFEELLFALLIGAMTRKERANPYGGPRVGHSIYRRALLHLGETFEEDNVKCLMCFVCGCKYLYHQGFDKLGKPVSKGDIEYHRNTGDVLRRLLHGDADDSMKTAWSFNLSRKRFKDRLIKLLV